MATRSAIGVLNIDGTVNAIYCHWDGYPEGVGRTLIQHWCDEQKINSLIELGDLSMLRSEIGEAHDFNVRWSLGDPQSKWCLAYGRDRGDLNTGHRVFTSSKEFVSEMSLSGCEYFYLWVDGRWRVSEGTVWSDMTLKEIVMTKGYRLSVYKMDRRLKTGRRFVKSYDYPTYDETGMRGEVVNLRSLYPQYDGWILEYHPLTKTVVNLMSEKPVEIAYDTSGCCDPSTETYWST